MTANLDTKALRARKQHPIERIRDAFSRAHNMATGVWAHYMSIPADPERDADLILSDAIDELAALRNAAPALLDAAERAQASEAIESALQESRDGWVKLYTDANAERDSLNDAMAEAWDALDGYGRETPSLALGIAQLQRHYNETRIERDALKAELSWIDSVLARRPALDKPTRAANIEHAINVAKQADALKADVERLGAACRALIDSQRGQGAKTDEIREAQSALCAIEEHRK